MEGKGFSKRERSVGIGGVYEFVGRRGIDTL